MFAGVADLGALLFPALRGVGCLRLAGRSGCAGTPRPLAAEAGARAVMASDGGIGVVGATGGAGGDVVCAASGAGVGGAVGGAVVRAADCTGVGGAGRAAGA